MIPSYNLSIPRLTKKEMLNSQAYKIYKNYKMFLDSANSSKEIFLDIKEKLKTDNSNEKLIKALEFFKKDATDNWNKSQTYLNRYNEFKNINGLD